MDEANGSGNGNHEDAAVPPAGGRTGEAAAAAAAADQGIQTDPPPEACDQHWKWGKTAYFCSNEETCPWKANVAPPKDRRRYNQ